VVIRSVTKLRSGLVTSTSADRIALPGRLDVPGAPARTRGALLPEVVPRTDASGAVRVP
jgi:hypothetical protein